MAARLDRELRGGYEEYSVVGLKISDPTGHVLSGSDIWTSLNWMFNEAKGINGLYYRGLNGQIDIAKTFALRSDSISQKATIKGARYRMDEVTGVVCVIYKGKEWKPGSSCAY